MNRDIIEIRRLKVKSRIGVPDEERAFAQYLWVSVWMTPSQDFTGLADKIAHTIDYHQVSIHIAEIAAVRPRHLIETLATDIASFLLCNFPLVCVDVEVEKRILPDADAVAVRITRSRTN